MVGIILVILASFELVLQRVICRLKILEFFFGQGVIWVLVRMRISSYKCGTNVRILLENRDVGLLESRKMQNRKPTGFSKRLFDLVVRCISADTENLVEVNFAGCHYPSLLGPRGGQDNRFGWTGRSQVFKTDGGWLMVGGYRSDETSLQR